MIQAPQMQYIPVQQAVQQGYQQGGYNPVQYNAPQTPGVFYNYPVASCYAQPYCTEKSQYNGVNIEIINPQGQGVFPNYAQQMPVQQPIMMPQPMPYMTQVPMQAPQQPAVQQPVPQQAPVQQQVPPPQIVTPAQQAPVQQAEAPKTTPVVDKPAANTPAVSPESFAGKLKSTDLEAQKAAIEEVAENVKNNDTVAPILLDTVVFDALVDIIDKDTSNLQGPTPEVIELRKKPQDKLTADEKAKASTPSELEKAEINKQYSLYTISYMQERLNNELEKKNGKALELKDLPCIDKVVDTVKSNPNPMLRISAIASLSYIARPEYKADLATIFDIAKTDEDARVKEAATKAAEALSKK